MILFFKEKKILSVSVDTCIKIDLFSFQARIKKIMQTDEEIGKVAAAVPVIICILSACSRHCASFVLNDKL